VNALVSEAAYVSRCVTLAPMKAGPNRRTTLAAAVVGAAAVATGCSNGRRPVPSPSSGPATGASPSTSGADGAADSGLRERAVADERALLAACAAPAGLEPYATLTTVHRAHLRSLTQQTPPTPPPTPAAPDPAALARREATAAAARRTDCAAASPALAPLLAELSAAGRVAVALLG
jgi:hypothetical protein